MDTSLDQDFTNNALTETSRAYLKTASGWALFVSIIGFIAAGLTLIGGLLFAYRMSSVGDFPSMFPFPPVVITLVYVFLTAIIAIPMYHLFKFSRRAAVTAANSESLTLEETLKYIMYYVKSTGIMTIIVIALYFIIRIWISQIFESNL